MYLHSVTVGIPTLFLNTVQEVHPTRCHEPCHLSLLWLDGCCSGIHTACTLLSLCVRNYVTSAVWHIVVSWATVNNLPSRFYIGLHSQSSCVFCNRLINFKWLSWCHKCYTLPGWLKHLTNQHRMCARPNNQFCRFKKQTYTDIMINTTCVCCRGLKQNLTFFFTWLVYGPSYCWFSI